MKKNDKKVLIRIDHLKQYFPVKKSSILSKEQLYVKANDDISLDIYEGETFGLVGESGCGKSTLGRTILQLYEQTDGRTIYYGKSIEEVAPKYVIDTLTNLAKERERLNDLRKKEEEARLNFESLPEGKDEKFIALEKYREIRKQADNLFLDIVELIGGFMCAEDLELISKVLVSEHNESISIYRLESKLEDDKTKLKRKKSALTDKGKTETQIYDALKVELDRIEKQEKLLVVKKENLQKIHEQIDELTAKYQTNPDFERYEAYKDKGINLARLTEDEMRLLRKDMQLIFQDPYSSLNPRMTVGQIISEGLLAHNMFERNDKELEDYVIETMEKCGLANYFLHRYPHQFSGGQRQRIGIARSVALNPKFIVCDEAVSALDVSIQSQIINLLLDLKEQDNLTYLFISHDLSVIKYISDRVGVMYLGNIVEVAETGELYTNPLHPYTEALLSAIPTTDLEHKREVDILSGDIPSPINPPSGCKFHTRCKYATDICKKLVPEFKEEAPGHWVACHHILDNSGGKKKGNDA